MSSRISLPQELVNEVINNLSDNADFKVCSLVSGVWVYPASSRLFHHIRVRPGDVDGWLFRPPDSVQRMAPHIFKFELSEHEVKLPDAPHFYWDDSEGLLTRVISSLALSPIKWLRIESFCTGGFTKTTLEQCFEPICHSLRSLELNNFTAHPDATVYLVSLFPNLDDLHIGNALSIPTQPAPEWDECGIKYSGRLSGTLRFSGVRTEEEKLFTGIVSLSPRPRAISPGGVSSLKWSAVQMLMDACAGTVESVPLVWGMCCGLCGRFLYTLLTTSTIGCFPPDLFTSCKKLRKIGFGIWEDFDCSQVQKTLYSITSEHLSTVSLELAYPDWYIACHTCEDFCQWRGLEGCLCHLADWCLTNNKSRLVLEIVWWRPDGHEGDCGTIPHNETIVPRFREKGLVRFAESSTSDCQRCAEILSGKPQTSCDI